MFPDARNSLRRWSVSAETKIPIPIAITLHNFVPPSATSERSSLTTTNRSNSNDIGNNDIDNDNDNGNDNESYSSPSKEVDAARRNRGMWLHRQPQHNNNLLPRLNLEITVTPQQQQGQGQEELAEGISAVPAVVYSANSPRTRSVHPSWEHLEERIQIDKYSDWWNQNELYKSMKVKLWVVSNEAQGKKQEDNQRQGIEDDYFLEAYLHPSFLERIDIGSNNSNNNNIEDIVSNSLLPPALPPNAMLVHFSDGSIRCPPQIYQVLWDNYGHSHGILEPPPVEDFSRFEDEVFDTLDQVKQTPQRPRERSVSSLLDQDHDYINANDHDISNDEDGVSRQLLLQDEEKSSPPSQKQYPTTSPQRIFTPRQAAYKNKKPTKQPYHQHDVPFSCSEQGIIKEERRQEKRDLLRLIAEEERALEEDIDCLKVEQKTMTNLMEQVQVVERDIGRVKTELHKQSLKWEREEFLKEAQSIKLFRDLRDVYPITLDSIVTSSSGSIINHTRGARTEAAKTKSGGNEGYLIRGLRLPVDIYTTSILEEEVNASLGYCAHLVFMVAKYLTIQLRHRIFYNGSRSAIELDGVGIFPLFLGRLAARALEREQVDRGARLLGANVDCIMMNLNLLPSSSSLSLQQSHILARLEQILNFVAEGSSGR